MRNVRSDSGIATAFGIFMAMGLFLPDWTRQGTATEPVRTPRQIEADWLRQEEVRWLPPSPRNRPETGRPAVAPPQDAAGGVDGVKNGSYGFHTGGDAKPWWQVDLGQPVALDRIVIYNRGDGNVEDRAARLHVLLGNDGENWTTLYQHDGAKFSGFVDNKPLVVPAKGKQARFVRIQLPEVGYLHLDEVEVYAVGSKENVALHKPANQSSVSPWSTAKIPGPQPDATAVAEAKPAPTVEPVYPLAATIERGRKLAEDLRKLGANVDAEVAVLDRIASSAAALSKAAGEKAPRDLYLQARWAIRRMALANPLLDFDDLLFVKRAPGTFTHMSDQNYGWFSRPGGGLFLLKDFKSDNPSLHCLTESLPLGSVLSPDISYDGKKVLFSHCKFYPGLRDEPNKLDKSRVPEDAFYHIYEMNLDGTGLRRLTRGKYDDFDARYLPNGEIVFLSTRRGQHVQCSKATAAASLDGANPDSYVRCGGGPERPVAVYTLHVMDANGGNLRPISAFEMFEWTPSVDHQGRILYARWDYVDRWNMPFMKLWSTMPDGTNAQAIYGNYSHNPHCVFEARAIPNSRKLIFTASGHHANTGGSLVLLDYNLGADNPAAMTRLTPEVCFPETEGWPKSYFVNPWPLAENHYLVAWSDLEMIGWPGPPEPVNATGIYLFDAFGNLNLLYRDPAISSMSPLPVRPRPRPPAVASEVAWDGAQEGRMLLLDVYDGLETIPRGTIKRLRLVGVPVKTHPTMNYPQIGVTHDDPGKFVLGSVPVEEDGSAFFRVPSGVSIFFQALDAEGMAVQTMRSAAYVQPGQTYTCVGCHEPRNTSPANLSAAALGREPSKIKLGPEGSWPLDFHALVQPVLETHCVGCHKPGGKDPKFDLTAAKSYNALVNYGKPSLREHVLARYLESRSIPGAGASHQSPLLKLLRAGHYDVKLPADAWERLAIWMDTYGQVQGHFGPEQEASLRQLRRNLAGMLTE